MTDDPTSNVDGDQYDLNIRPCAVGFLDILGFREIALRLPTDQRLQRTIGAFLRRASHTADVNRNRAAAEGGFGFTAFSDSIVVSKPVDDSGWAEWLVCFELGAIAADLLGQGILSRGGVTGGLLHHSDGIVIGEAMVTAYELESRVARYPRIVVQDAVREAVLRSQCKGVVADTQHRMFFRDSDGCWVIEPFLDDWFRKEDASVSARSAIEEGIRRLLGEAPVKPEILAKYRWVATRFNGSSIRTEASLAPISLD